jgi:hypothetical protein
MKFFLITACALSTIFAQTYQDDSLAVRAILDSNGLFNVNVTSVTTASGGFLMST